jgi:glucosamine 6-phosphate synthetase-like amidotransferase/phosphosugar isomerase protein
MRLSFVPQLAFAISCAGAVFWYVANNIEEIKEKQGKAIAIAQTEQSSAIKNAQEQQRAAIEKVKLQQEENARKARQSAEEAKSRAENLRK